MSLQLFATVIVWSAQCK